MIMESPTIMAAMPVSKQLGMIVKAGSLPCGHIFWASPIAEMKKPPVDTFLCRVSKKPWLIPEIPESVPKVAAFTLVALFISALASLNSLPNGGSSGDDPPQETPTVRLTNSLTTPNSRLEDKRANDRAVKEGTRILSAYDVLLEDGETVRIWIITEADRSVTTALLPEEY
jgi:hypothetical protein